MSRSQMKARRGAPTWRDARRIALDGANHVERLQILRQFVQGLGATEVQRLKQARIYTLAFANYFIDAIRHHQI